jgi:hypothetical protein
VESAGVALAENGTKMDKRKIVIDMQEKRGEADVAF